MNATLQSSSQIRPAAKRRSPWRGRAFALLALLLVAGAGGGGWVLWAAGDTPAERPAHRHGRAWRYRGQHDGAGQPAAARIRRCRHPGLRPASPALFRCRPDRRKRRPAGRDRPDRLSGARRGGQGAAPQPPRPARGQAGAARPRPAAVPAPVEPGEGERHQPRGAAERRPPGGSASRPTSTSGEGS